MHKASLRGLLVVMRIDILDIPIDAITQRDALVRIAGFLKSEGQYHIATPNPEMLVEAHRNPEFKKVLQGTELNLPDGVGVVWVIRKKRSSAVASSAVVVSRVTGTDTLQQICSLESRLCPPERVFLLGAAPGIAEKASKILKEKNSALNITGTYSGSPKEEDEEEIISRINAAQPTILFVAFGAPSQDLWIARNLPKLKTVKVAMGVGGALDFIAGKQKRAPKLMRQIGLEWLWRLMREPRRIKRIWRAVVLFTILVLVETRNSYAKSEY